MKPVALKSKPSLCLMLMAGFSLGWGLKAEAAPPVEKPSCARSDAFHIVDLSMPLTKIIAANGISGLDALKGFGVRTIIRYYDMPNETLPCKTLLPEESDAILTKGFSIGVVFQHNGDDPAIFAADPATARAHAQRALDLAAANGQPSGSAIYFGVDGADLHLAELAQTARRRAGQPVSEQELATLKRTKRTFALRYNAFLKYRDRVFGAGATITAESLYPFVKRYFDTVKAVFRLSAKRHQGRSYKIGIYCTAGLCDYALKNSLADFYWVTAEGRNDPAYQRFVDADHWNLLQQRETACDNWVTRGAGFDYNRQRLHGAFGAWSHKEKSRLRLARPLTCPAL